MKKRASKAAVKRDEDKNLDPVSGRMVNAILTLIIRERVGGSSLVTTPVRNTVQDGTNSTDWDAS